MCSKPVGGGGWGCGRVGVKDGRRGHANSLESEVWLGFGTRKTDFRFFGLGRQISDLLDKAISLAVR